MRVNTSALRLVTSPIAPVNADQLGPVLREALAADRPTVIQAPMENAPTPTPGHWNINDIYRLGE